ncbi:unnamed protein product [Rhizophagus irregularis]|uniref:Uncharacterized protein n=1 Tax=Rhizophagus irregularis TaxID=588596 RepID=A0A915Z1C1_9GLOM|nr:unnamed protein product [Rhizophagus irregularis]CAB5357153.1 unnamed protein product [Rhizophagus irregularis]
MKSLSINYVNILFIQLFGYEIQRFKNFKRSGTIIMEVTVCHSLIILARSLSEDGLIDGFYNKGELEMISLKFIRVVVITSYVVKF